MDAGQSLSFLYPFIFSVIVSLFVVETWMYTLGIGIAVTCSLFLFNQYLSRRTQRIDRVSSNYSKVAETGVVKNGLNTLLKCGCLELRNQAELDEVLKRICARFPHPNELPEKLPNKKVLAFLRFCHREKHKIESVDDVAFALALFAKDIVPFET
jgi:hypothetical protein